MLILTLSAGLKRGGLFYMQKDLFDSPDTLDYASVVFPSRHLVLEGS